MFICCDLKANRGKEKKRKTKGESVSDLESMTYL